MKFYINCQTFIRLAGVCNYFSPFIEPEMKDKLNTLRLENLNGKTIAIITNHKIAVIEYLSDTTEPDGFAHVKLDPQMIGICAAMGDNILEITTIPEILFATAQSCGFSYNGNACHWFNDSPLNEWRSWAGLQGKENIPKKSKGAMVWNLSYIQSLIAASPSGRVVFPEFIDVDKPVVIRDRVSPKWAALFLAKPAATDIDDVIPAALPAWWL